MREHREKSKGSQKPILNAIKDLKNVDLLTSAEVYRNQKKNFPVMPWFQSTPWFHHQEFQFSSPPFFFGKVRRGAHVVHADSIPSNRSSA